MCKFMCERDVCSVGGRYSEGVGGCVCGREIQRWSRDVCRFCVWEGDILYLQEVRVCAGFGGGQGMCVGFVWGGRIKIIL